MRLRWRTPARSTNTHSLSCGRECQEWTKTHVETCQLSSGNFLKSRAECLESSEPGTRAGTRGWWEARRSKLYASCFYTLFQLKPKSPAGKHTVLGLKTSCVYTQHTHYWPTSRALFCFFFFWQFLKDVFIPYIHTKKLLEVHPRTIL